MNDRVKLLGYWVFDPAKPKISSDLAPQIAKREYELYDQAGRHDGHAAQDWAKAEEEIRRNSPRN